MCITPPLRDPVQHGLLLNPARWFSMARAGASSVPTDGLGFGEMRTLANAIHGAGAGGVWLLTVPLANPLRAGVPTADVAWDPVKAPRLWAAIRRDRPSPGSERRTRHRPSAAVGTASTEGCLD